MKTILPLSGKGKQINYEYTNDGFDVKWGKTAFHIPNALIDDILKNFLIDKNIWYPLGADMINPMPKGLGSSINSKHIGLNPRHSCVISAIMHEEKMIETKGQKPIFLKRK